MSDMHAIILAGGLGTRLHAVLPDHQKVMAPVNGRPFLDILLRFLNRCGLIDRVVLATGHHAEQIREHYRTHEFAFEIVFSEEKQRLGTGGAIKLALAKTDGETVLAMNGDSFIEFDLNSLLMFHERQNADMSLVLRQVEDAGRYGAVQCAPSKRITAFREKIPVHGPGLINGGVYLFDRNVFDSVPEDERLSIETDILPRLVKEKCLFGMASSGRFLDIGLPETYLLADNFFADMSNQVNSHENS